MNSVTCKPNTIFSEEMRNSILSELESNDYVLIEGKNLPIPESLQQSFDELASLFGDLISDEDNYTGTRFERVRSLDQDVFQLSPEDQASHHPQSLTQFDYITLYKNPFFLTLIESTSALLPKDKNKETMCRDVRVSLSRHSDSCSQLELHQDYDRNFQISNLGQRVCASKWVVQYNIHRSQEGIEGGEILIGNGDKEVVATKLLSERLDAYIVNNRRFYHGANAITVSKPGAARDVIIMEFRT
jgi:hypothetical protein